MDREYLEGGSHDRAKPERRPYNYNNFLLHYRNDGSAWMRVTRPSMLSGEVHTMELAITVVQFERWMEGEVIQRAMPNLSKEEREFLISGITPEEWAATFGKDGN